MIHHMIMKAMMMLSCGLLACLKLPKNASALMIIMLSTLQNEMLNK